MVSKSKFALGVVAGVMLAGVMAGSVLTATAQSTLTNSPAITTTALSTSSAQIIGTNATRKGIIICNPGAVVEWIAPAPATAVANAGISLPAVATGTTACFTLTGNIGSVGNAWNGISASATPNITVLELF